MPAVIRVATMPSSTVTTCAPRQPVAQPRPEGGEPRLGQAGDIVGGAPATELTPTVAPCP
jgi:hypothetical protein